MSLRGFGCYSLLIVLTGRAQQPFDLDQSFQTTIGSQNISSLIPLDDGKVLVAGRFDYPGATIQLKMGRLESTGAWDQTYTANSYGGGKLTDWQGKFYVQSTTIVRRVLYDGAIDPTFIGMNTGLYFSSGLGGDYYVYPDGRILMSGSHHLQDSVRGYVGDYNLIWFSNEGYLDTTQHHRACDGHIEYIHPLPDGKFLLGGFWSQYDNIPTPNSTHLIRVFPDGALDTTFQCPIIWGSPVSHLFLSDGKHLIGGSFRVNGDPDTLQVMRLMPNGAIDTLFNYHEQYLYAYTTQPSFAGVVGFLHLDEGRTVIVGGFTSVDGMPRGGIALLDSAGHLLDDHFIDAGCGVWNDGFQDRAYISGIVPAADGSYYIHGSYHGYNDGTTNDTGQRMVSRLYGLDVGVREERLKASGLQVYPNPAEGLLHVQWRTTGGNYTLSLLDILGREVLRQDVSALGQQAELDLKGIASGTYYLHLRDGKRWLAGSKVVVE